MSSAAGRKGTAVLLVALLLGLLLSMGASYRVLQARAAAARGEAGDPEGHLLVQLSRRPALSFGFRNVLADATWLAAVQVAGKTRLLDEDHDRLYFLLDAVANYDPRVEAPYLLGGLVLGESPGHAGRALAILERGRASHPRDWPYPFYIGYTQYFSLGDPLAGGRSMIEAAGLPGSPPYLGRLATRMLAEGRNPDMALDFTAAALVQESDPGRRAVLERRILEVLVERDIQRLEALVAEHRARTGTVPSSLEALVEAGLIREIPREPNGGSYRLLPNGTVASDRVPGRLRVFRKR